MVSVMAIGRVVVRNGVVSVVHAPAAGVVLAVALVDVALLERAPVEAMLPAVITIDVCGSGIELRGGWCDEHHDHQDDHTRRPGWTGGDYHVETRNGGVRAGRTRAGSVQVRPCRHGFVITETKIHACTLRTLS